MAILSGTHRTEEEARGSRFLIRALWSGLPVLALAYGLLGSMGPDRPVAFAASQFTFLIATWLAFFGALLAVRATAGIRERGPWVSFAFACFFIAAALTYISIYRVLVDPRGAAGFSPANVLYGVGALAFTVGLVLAVARSPVPRTLKALRVVDAMGIAILVFAAVYAANSLVPRRVPRRLLDEASDATYVAAGILVVIVALNVIASRARRRHRWELVLGAGLGLFGVAVMLAPQLYVYIRIEGAQLGEILIGTTFLCGSYLVFLAGVYRFLATGASSESMARPAADVLAGHRWSSVVTSTVLLVAIPILGVSALRTGIDPQHATVNLIAMALVGAAMVAHTGLDAVYTGRLRRRAGTDPLTGLPDARSLHSRLAEAITGYGRYGDQVSVVVFDLNDFRRINTLYGREEGDRLMVEVARTLPPVLPSRAVLGRLGSDEFMAILEGSDRAEALVIADRVREGLHGLLTSAGLPLTASWGVASCPQDSVRSRDLISKAYSAQHWAKTRGRNRLASYDASRMRALDQVARITAAEEHADLTLLLAIATASEARHETTRFHSRNVAAMSVLVAELTGATAEEVFDVEIAALLHDIGKTGVSDSVLTKREPRSRAEETLFREHVLIGERIVAATQLRRVAPAVRAHHERWDGGGYPDGLSAEEIPRLARIIAVCDAFEGLTSGRPDRRPLSVGAALQELDQNMGVSYDPVMVEALIAVSEKLPGMRRDEGEGTQR
jgi:diguanylate cyclase (GGDEF)-like protein